MVNELDGLPGLQVSNCLGSLLICGLFDCLIVWLFSGLVDILFGSGGLVSLVDWLPGWLVGWLVGWLAWLVGWLGWVGGLVGWFGG